MLLGFSFMESCFIIQCRFSSSNLVRSSNWHFAHLVLQFPSTEHLHGNPHETSKGQISTFFDGGAKYLPNFSTRVQFLAPQHLHRSATKKHQFCPTFMALLCHLFQGQGSLSSVWIDGLGVGPRPHPCVPPGSCGSMSGS